MKIQKYIMTRILAAGALLLAGSAQLRAMAIGNLTIAAFATGVQGENDPGGQYNGDCLEIPYGNGTIWWDGITFDSAQNSTGSAYLDTIFNTSDGIALLASIGPGFNDLWYEGPCGVPGWTLLGTVDFSQYLAIQFEILWDTTSTLSIDQYNTGLNWPGETSGFNADVTAGVEVDMFTGSGGGMVELGTFLIPDSAATNWQTVTIPINESLPGLTAGAGVCFQKYCGNYAALQSTHNGGFWVDPVILVGNAAPPPSMSAPIAAVPGLNIFNGTETSGSFYDRNEVVCTTTSGLSWIGQSGASYSFNMAGYPNVPAYNGEAYMFLVPNAGCEDNAPDWNEAACMILEVQSTSAGPASRASGQAFLSYKTTAPNAGNDTNILFSSYSGPSAPGTGTSVPSARLLGAYTLTFTENDQGTLATPDGTVGSFSLPAGTGATYFTEGPIGSAVEPVPSGAPRKPIIIPSSFIWAARPTTRRQ